jgi:hypothetical protein
MMRYDSPQLHFSAVVLIPIVSRAFVVVAVPTSGLVALLAVVLRVAALVWVARIWYQRRPDDARRHVRLGLGIAIAFVSLPIALLEAWVSIGPGVCDQFGSPEGGRRAQLAGDGVPARTSRFALRAGATNGLRGPSSPP